MGRLLLRKFDRNDVVILLALVVLVYGLWPSLGRAALVPSALVLLWMTVPQRRAFIERPRTIVKKSKVNLSVSGAAEEHD